MPAQLIKNQTGKVLVIGPIYDNIEKLSKIEPYIPKYELIIFNGNLCYPYDNMQEVEKRLERMSKFLTNPKVRYNLGNYDLLLLHKTQKELDQENICNWLKSKSNVIIVKFQTGNTLIVTSGGVTPEMTLKDLTYNVETSFVSHIQGKPWHTSYGGGMGYVLSNSPLTQTSPKFYNFSAQIGNTYSEKLTTYMIEIDGNGISNTFSA